MALRQPLRNPVASGLGQGDEAALESARPVVHAELRRSRAVRWVTNASETLQPTALVNEAYLRLVDVRQIQWQDRAHFFRHVPARVMRRVLSMPPARGCIKTRSGAHQVSLDESMIGGREAGPDLIALDDALKALAVIDERKSQVVEMRFFGGLSVEETAEALCLRPDGEARLDDGKAVAPEGD